MIASPNAAIVTNSVADVTRSCTSSRARIGAALDAVYVVAHDFADRREPRRFAGQHDPGRKPPGPAAVERVEHDVDEVAELALARAQAHDRRFDRSGQLAHHLAHQLGLQPGRRAEVMNEIGVTHPQVGRHGLQRDRVGPSASNRRRADASARVRASSGVRRTRRALLFFATGFAFATIDTTLSK